jgi:lipopolysaccharide export system protein LptA
MRKKSSYYRRCEVVMYSTNKPSSLAYTALLSTILFSILSSAPPALAIDPSSKLPIQIESDRATLDDATGISNYAGNVIITQGESMLEADNISVNTVNRKIVSIKATGTPAHFIQKTPKENILTHGYANTIIYTAIDASLKLLTNASLVQDNNSFSGEQIHYDIVKRAIRARGDKAGGTRVKIQYFPQTNETTNEPIAPKTLPIQEPKPPTQTPKPTPTPTPTPTPNSIAPIHENP